MATGSVKGNAFWVLIGIGILALLLAAAWRVATGAELDAKGKEWSLKVTEAADSLDNARKQIEAEAERQKEVALKREAYWGEQVKIARAECPKADIQAPPPPTSTAASSAIVAKRVIEDAARTSSNARDVANELRNLRLKVF